MAPCDQNGMLTLTCCKPMIRREAVDGDYVIGFLPKRFGRGRVAYVGRVAERLKLADYQRQHPSRHDAIYRGVKGTQGEEVLEPTRGDYHEDEPSRRRDRAGLHSLQFAPYWYWGGHGILAPEEVADLAHYYVGQSARGSTPERIALLEAWLGTMGAPGTYGVPRDELRTPAAAAGRGKRRNC